MNTDQLFNICKDITRVTPADLRNSPTAAFYAGWTSEAHLQSEEADAMIFLTDSDIERFLDEEDLDERAERGQLDADAIQEPDLWPIDRPELLDESELTYLMEVSHNGDQDL